MQLPGWPAIRSELMVEKSRRAWGTVNSSPALSHIEVTSPATVRHCVINSGAFGQPVSMPTRIGRSGRSTDTPMSGTESARPDANVQEQSEIKDNRGLVTVLSCIEEQRSL